MLTITGGPFIEDDLDQTIVKVGYKWWEYIDNYCYLLTASETEVTCRLPLDLNREAKEYEVIAFAATYEESNCEFDDCQFTFIASDQLPSVSSYSISYESSETAYVISIAGTEFTDAASDIQLFLNDIEQSVISATSSLVRVKVDEVESGLENNRIDFYFSVGIPNGYTELLDGATFAPVLLSLSTNLVSTAGSKIQAVVIGAGVSDELTLVNADSQEDVCLSSQILEYGILECELDPELNLFSRVTLSVREIVSGTIHACQNADTSLC